MDILDWIFVGIITAIPAAFLVWIVVKRRRVFYNVHFTAETVWKNFQSPGKQNAVEYVDYLKEKEEEDEAGDTEIPGESSIGGGA